MQIKGTNIYVSFNDLNSDAQIRLYYQDKKQFAREAAKSRYTKVKLLVAKDEDTASEILELMLKEEIRDMSYKIISEIYNNKSLIKSDNVIRMIMQSDECSLKELIVRDKEISSKMLNEVVRYELENEGRDELVEALINHENFCLETETRNAILKSKMH